MRRRRAPRPDRRLPLLAHGPVPADSRPILPVAVFSAANRSMTSAVRPVRLRGWHDVISAD